MKESIQKVLQQKHYPEQNYKSCVGILNLATKVGNERLENACKRALSFEAVGYNQIKNILERGLDKEKERSNLSKTTIIAHDNIRGCEYFC